VRTASTGWSVEAVTDQPSAQSGASVALDARDSVFVSWLGDVGMALVTTQYSERQAGIWSLPTIVESAGTGWAASLWWASRPVVRGQRTNVVTIGCVLAFAYLGGSPTVPEVHYYGACANPT
jgi:hypothetical protein